MSQAGGPPWPGASWPSASWLDAWWQASWSGAGLSGLVVALAVVLARPAPATWRLRRVAGPRRPRGPAGWLRSRLPGGRPRPWPAAVNALPGSAEVAALAEQIAAMAAAGLPVGRAWPAIADRSASGAVRALASAVQVAQHRGVPTAEALRAGLLRQGSRPGRTARRHRPATVAVRQLIVALDVSERTGAALATTLVRLAEALRAEDAAEQERQTALAGPRASAMVLSLLPLAGLALGGLLGGSPGAVLLGTGPGRACLVVGGLLWAAGRAWAAALVRRAADPP